MKERADFVVPLFNVRPRGPLDPEDINPLTGRFFLYAQRRLCAFKGDHDYHILRFQMLWYFGGIYGPILCAEKRS